MSRKIILSIVGVLAAVFYLSSVAIAAGPNTDPRCVGLTGAAFGLCQAATAVGCDDPATQNPGCASIEDNFTQMTGENPPWLAPLCPCSEYYQKFVATSWGQKYEDGDCTVYVNQVPPIYVIAWHLAVEDAATGSYYTLRAGAGVGGPSTCSADSDYLDPPVTLEIEDAEVFSCFDEIEGIASMWQVPCYKQAQ